MVKSQVSYLMIGFIFMVYTLSLFGIYHQRTLRGDINNHILAAKMFGVPKDLEARGIKPRYNTPWDCGWDGQFYYYMSNDILAQKDTAQHIDSPSYRYQRIGLPLYVAIVSKLLGKVWVSPLLFYVSYFALIVLTTWIGALFFASRGLPPVAILLWSLGISTQITLSNALPDAAADAFFILGVAALLSKRVYLAIVPLTFAALSREVYVVFPVVFFCLYFFDAIVKERRQGDAWTDIFSRLLLGRTYYFLLLPVVVFIGWRCFINVHFGVAPASQAYGVLGMPLKSWWAYFISGVQGQHLLVGKGRGALFETGALFFFLGMLILTLVTTVSLFFKKKEKLSLAIKALGVTSFILVGLYLCFGKTVIMYFTGYFKAIGIFFFIIPLFFVEGNIPKRIKMAGSFFMIAAFVFSSIYFIQARVLPLPEPEYVHTEQTNEK